MAILTVCVYQALLVIAWYGRRCTLEDIEIDSIILFFVRDGLFIRDLSSGTEYCTVTPQYLCIYCALARCLERGL